MNHKWKHFNCLIPAIIILAGLLAILCTWSPLILTIYNYIYGTPQYNGFEIPTRVVGVNYPTDSFIWLGFSFVISILIVVLLAKRKKASSFWFWINGIFFSIIISHMVLWGYWLNPFLLIRKHQYSPTANN